MPRNEFGDAVAQPVATQRGIVGADHCGQHVPTPLAGHRHDCRDRGADTRQSVQRGLDVAELDAIAADLDPVVGPADELQRAVRPVPGEIAGAVPRAAQVADEPVGSQIRTPTVATRDAAPGDPQFTRHPVGTIGAQRIHHAARVVRERSPVRHGGPWSRRIAGLVQRGVHSGFGGTAQPGEAHPGRLGLKASHHRGAHPVPAGRHCPHRLQPSIADFHQHFQPARQEVQHGDAVGVDLLGPVVGITALVLVDDDDRAAGGQGAEHVAHRQVAFQVDQRQASVGGPNPEVAVEEFDGVHGGVVGDLYTFGLAGRTRGEQHVGQSVGIGWGGLESAFAAAHAQCFGDCECGQRCRRRLVAADQRHADAAGVDDASGPVGRMVDADRQVDAAGGEDAEQRGDLVGALWAPSPRPCRPV